MATTRKPVAPVTNPRASQNQAGRTTTPVQKTAVVDQSALRINPRSAEAINEVQKAQHAVALTTQDNSQATRDALGDLRKYQAQLATAIPGSAQYEALQRQVQGKQNQINILQSGTYATTSTAGGQRALQETYDRAGNLDQLMQDPLYREGVAGAAGQPGAMGFNPDTNPDVKARGDAAASRVADQYRSMGVYDPALIAEAEGKARTAVYNEAAAGAAYQTAEGERLRRQAGASVLGAKSAQDAAIAPQSAALSPSVEQALQSLPPEQAALLRASIIADQQAATTGRSAAMQNYSGEVAAADKSLSAYDRLIDNQEAEAKLTKEEEIAAIEEDKKRQDEALAEAKKTAHERLAWEENKNTRDSKKALDKQITGMISAQALSGGYGSSNWTAEVQQAEYDGEQAIIDMQTQFGFKRADVDIAYTNAINEVYSVATNAKSQAYKDYRAVLSSSAEKRFAAAEKTDDRKTKARETLRNSLAEIEKEQAKGIKAAYKDVLTALEQEHADKSKSEIQAWDRLKWAKTTYGVNVPESEIQALSKALPGVDVRALIASPTAAEIEKKQKALRVLPTKTSSGVSVGAVAFGNSEYNAIGQPPAFDEFLRSKELEALSSGADTFDISPDEMKAYKEEYEAKINAANRYEPSAIRERFDAKKYGMSIDARKTAQAELNKKLAVGDNQGAANLVADFGKPLDATQEKTFMQALTARSDILTMANKVEALGSIGPVSGRVRELNPYDDRVVEFGQLVTQAVPNLARGVFNEVGVLTDSDVERYTSTMANPELTIGQAQTAVKNLTQKINTQLQLQLDVAEANGRRVRQLRQIYESGGSSMLPADNPAAVSTDNLNYLRSLNLH